MQRLILLRHAKAESRAPSGDDFDRALSERGRTDAALMGRVLAEAGSTVTLALVSAAARTRQTWELAAPALGAGAEVRHERRLYNASSGTLRSAVEAEEGGEGTLVLVGHNPGIHQLVLDLLIAGAAPASTLERASQKFPPASAAVFDLDVAGRPVFQGLYFPKDHGGGAAE
jgi:phosphohistidine phosphatase